MQLISSIMIPLIVLVVIIYGLIKKVDIYDTFIDGAKESFDMILNMFPCLLGMILAINIFAQSGFLEAIFNCFKPVLQLLNIPNEILPMTILRPISGSSTLALLNNIFKSNGPDSFIGRLASVIQGSTDTTFYIITLYFGSVGIKKIKYALWAGLFADLVGIIASILIVEYLF